MDRTRPRLCIERPLFGAEVNKHSGGHSRVRSTYSQMSFFPPPPPPPPPPPLTRKNMAGLKPARPRGRHASVDGIIFTVADAAAVTDQTAAYIKRREDDGSVVRSSGAGLLSAHRLCHTKRERGECYATMSLAVVAVGPSAFWFPLGGPGPGGRGRVLLEVETGSRHVLFCWRGQPSRRMVGEETF